MMIADALDIVFVRHLLLKFRMKKIFDMVKGKKRLVMSG
jgi:hypothetical protein